MFPVPKSRIVRISCKHRVNSAFAHFARFLRPEDGWRWFAGGLAFQFNLSTGACSPVLR